MSRVRPGLWATILFAGLSMAGYSAASAETTVTLEGVTFADGGTASGSFTLNVYGYMEAADITTTQGTSMLGAALAGYSYLTAGAGVPNGPTPPFDSVFTFNGTADDFSLVLRAQNVVTLGGFDPLVAGSGSGGSLGGSYEYCTQGSIACGGPSYLDGRLVAAGTLYAPEPATLTLLGVGIVALPLVRRRRASAKRGAA
jgi:PEP-CTERM motif